MDGQNYVSSNQFVNFEEPPIQFTETAEITADRVPMVRTALRSSLARTAPLANLIKTICVGGLLAYIAHDIRGQRMRESTRIALSSPLKASR
ncbi:MAG: hypothetical protein HY817_04100 [Candidatus Abawacabacteria bacterium]|nr:hypothetical protein [Candidatus Abawacabacteria bacterium]